MQTILVINSGSSTIKFAVFNSSNLECVYKDVIDGVKDYSQAITDILNLVKNQGFEIIAAGHRIVHSGPNYAAPIILNEKIIADLKKLIPIMPLHQPHNLNGVKILQQKLPNIPQIGCFDTGFHATCNPIAQQYALPQKYTKDGIRRYGFHGLSYEYIASQLPQHMSNPNGKYIVAHLGNGATMCAIENQKSVATSIGFTAVGGLVMGTRCDSVDPGAVLYLMQQYNLNTDQMLKMFYKESGLLAISGISSDMRDLLASNKPAAKLAIDIFVHRIVTHTGMLMAELQGLDGFIFTAGIGENAVPIREKVCNNLSWLGINLDKPKNNQKINTATKISAENSNISVWVIPTNEELMIAKHTLILI